MRNRYVNNSKVLSYAFIALPVAFSGIPIYIFIPDYYHFEYGLSLSVLSLSLFFLRLIDALIDPVIGSICDNYGNHKKTLLFGVGFIFCVGFWILCFPIIPSILVNLIIGVLLSTIGFSFFTIYVNTIGALSQKLPENKAKLISIRESFTIIGILIASIIPFMLKNIFPIVISYILYALIFTSLLVVSIFLFYKWLLKQKNIFEKNINTERLTIRSYLISMNRHGYYLFFSYAISALGSAIPGVMLIFYSKYVLQSDTYTSLYLFLYFMGVILGIPVVRYLSSKICIVKIWRYSIYMAIIVFLGASLLYTGDIIQFSVISFLSGCFFSAEIILPNLLLANFIDNPKRAKLGNGFYSLLAFLSKFSFALATIISLPLLQLSLSENTPITPIVTIKIIYCIIPCILKFMATLILWRWEKCVLS